MAEKAFVQIREAEKEANTLIKNAEEEASRIIDRSEKEAEDAFSKLSKQCREQSVLRKKTAEADALANSIEFSKETEKLCAEIRAKLLLQKENAVDAIIKSIG